MHLDKQFLLILKSSGIGDGEPDLGERLMSSFLKMLIENGVVPARVICMNSGVFLTTRGSVVADMLRELESFGSQILTCGTCLDYYKRRDDLIVGEATNMKDTVSAMLSFPKIISP